MTLNGKEVVVKGAVLAMLADTQASHAIGGFKVGVGFSLRKCRNCLATRDTMSTQVHVAVCLKIVIVGLIISRIHNNIMYLEESILLLKTL